MKIYAYARVSSRSQDEKGTSAPIQFEKIKDWSTYKHKGVEVIELSDAVTGGMPLKERESGKLFFDLVKKGDIFVAAKFDRAFRNVADGLNVADELKKKGVGLVLLNISDSDVIKDVNGKLIFTVLIAVAEMEKDTIKTRMMEGKAAKRANGFWCGGRAPFGYKIKKTEDGSILIEDPETMPDLKRILEMDKAGYSLRTICKELNGKRSFAVIGKIINKQTSEMFKKVNENEK